MKFVPVNHLVGHCLSGRLVHRARLPFPFLALLVSGGHCLTALVSSPFQFSVIGETMDDSLGEALDKCARSLALPGGGKGLEAEALRDTWTGEGRKAETARRMRHRVPIPLRNDPTRDFSFSGLKAHIARLAEKRRSGTAVGLGELDDKGAVAEIAAAVQDAAFQHIADKTSLAMADALEMLQSLPPLERRSSHPASGLTTGHPEHAPLELPADSSNQRWSKGGSTGHAASASCQGEVPPAATRERIGLPLLVCGGVAGNQSLSRKLKAAFPNVDVVTLPRELCSDNAAMIAWAAIERGLEPALAPDLLNADPRLPLSTGPRFVNN